MKYRVTLHQDVAFEVDVEVGPDEDAAEVAWHKVQNHPTLPDNPHVDHYECGPLELAERFDNIVVLED